MNINQYLPCARQKCWKWCHYKDMALLCRGYLRLLQWLIFYLKFSCSKNMFPWTSPLDQLQDWKRHLFLNLNRRKEQESFHLHKLVYNRLPVRSSKNFRYLHTPMMKFFSNPTRNKNNFQNTHDKRLFFFFEMTELYNFVFGLIC